jgi:hypothetical protein
LPRLDPRAISGRLHEQYGNKKVARVQREGDFKGGAAFR